MQLIEIVLVTLLHVVVGINLQTDARGITLWFGYDNLNRLTQKRQTDAAGPLLAKYWYDEAQAGASNLGRRTRAEAYEYRDGWGSSTILTNTLTQSYDARGRVKAATRTVDGASYTTQYAYDPADRVTRITYPDGEQVTTAYGSQGQPASLSSTLGVTLADSASYDAANRLTSLRYPTGGNLVRRQVFYPWGQLNGRGRLQNLLVGTSATAADRLNLTYNYDAVGNVQSISDNGVLSSFGYDGLYQLTSAYGQSFGYDTAGRIVNFNGLAYTPDSSHPHAVNLVNGSDRYDYDANGNQVMRNKGMVNQEQALAWDTENRLSSVTYTNLAPAGGGGGPPSTLPKRVFLPLIMHQAPAERYSYDADGARVRKESKTEITRIIGPHYEVVVAVASGQVLTTTRYYDFGGQRIAVRQNGTMSYLHGDHLGSTSVATNASGAPTSSVRYFAYGGQRTGNVLALPTDHGFTGQKLDRGTGLLYYGARYYDSGLGTFISPDPLILDPGNPQDLNRYTYVTNNPLRYMDPSGHVYCQEDPYGELGPCLDDSGDGSTPGPAPIPAPTPPQGTPTPAQLAASQPGTVASWGWGALFTPDTIVTLYEGAESASDYAVGYVNAAEGYAVYKVLGKDGKEYWVAAGSAAALRKIGLNPGVANSANAMNAVRAAGRGGDGALYLVGWGASVGPNLAAHAIHGDFFSMNTATDLIVDTGGWAFSEGVGVAGAALGAATGFPPLALAGEVAGSLGGSVYWDNKVAPGARATVWMWLR